MTEITPASNVDELAQALHEGQWHAVAAHPLVENGKLWVKYGPDALAPKTLGQLQHLMHLAGKYREDTQLRRFIRRIWQEVQQNKRQISE